ncbi:MAG: hypothetical protein ACI4TX_00495, partial [Christensenellales bacterium]
MSEVFDNGVAMQVAGRNYFEELSKIFSQQYDALKNVKNVDEILNNEDLTDVSDNAKKEYKRLEDESEGSGFRRKFANL